MSPNTLHKSLNLEIGTVISNARYEWAHSAQPRSLNTDDLIARHLTKYVEARLTDTLPSTNIGFRIWVDGAPAPWGMGRAVGRGRRIKPQRLADWQDRVILQWNIKHGSTCLPGPVSFAFTFHVHRPHLDLDNLVKGAIDALKGRAFGNDDRVYSISTIKIPVEKEEEAGMELALASYKGLSFEKHAEDF